MALNSKCLIAWHKKKLRFFCCSTSKLYGNSTAWNIVQFKSCLIRCYVLLLVNFLGSKNVFLSVTFWRICLISWINIKCAEKKQFTSNYFPFFLHHKKLTHAVLVWKISEKKGIYFLGSTNKIPPYPHGWHSHILWDI